MITILAKIFIKNNKDFKDSEVRRKYGVLCGAFGIFLNILLFAGKFIAGLISKSLAVTADAFNNLSDAGSSLISLVGFKLAGKKPDSTHPFGHGRMEYVSGLIVSFLIILMGIELGQKSILNIIHPETIEFSWLSVGVLVASILVKVYMAVYNTGIGKKISSPAMSATAMDSLSDSIATAVVLISLFVSKYTGLRIDGIAGFVVSLFIVWSGIGAAKETIEPLLGTPADSEFVDEIEKIAMSHKKIKGIHDLVVHDYGPGRLMLSFHAEIDGRENPFEIHDEIDLIEFEINKKFNCETCIHTDPIDTENAELAEISNLLKEILSKIDARLKFHDLRMVPGESHTNIIFDVLLEPDLYGKTEEIRKKISEQVLEAKKNHFCVIQFDKKYCNFKK